MDRYQCRPELSDRFESHWSIWISGEICMDQSFGALFARKISMEQWNWKSVKSSRRDWYWSMDGSSQPLSKYCKFQHFEETTRTTETMRQHFWKQTPDQNHPLSRGPKLNTIFPQICRAPTGYPGISRQKDLISLVSRGIPNLSAPTPSGGRPLAHQKISGLKSLGLCFFFVPETKARFTKSTVLWSPKDLVNLFLTN